MNQGRFFVPRTRMNMVPIIGTNYLPSRRMGLFGKIGNSLKSFNWGNFLNNANKTINVVNQTIPLVRQAGPMFNNIRSMLRLAKAFGSETASNNFKNKNNNQQKNNINNNYNLNISDNDNFVQKKEVSNNNYPNFFI